MAEFDKLTEEKLAQSYNFNEKTFNFVTESELTVTITLAEYRELIERSQRYETKKVQAEKDRFYLENLDLKKRIAELETTVEALKKAMCPISTESKSEDE